jgi:hypothetical protein
MRNGARGAGEHLLELFEGGLVGHREISVSEERRPRKATIHLWE